MPQQILRYHANWMLIPVFCNSTQILCYRTRITAPATHVASQVACTCPCVNEKSVPPAGSQSGRLNPAALLFRARSC